MIKKSGKGLLDPFLINPNSGILQKHQAKEGSMNFNYNTLIVELNPKTRSLSISFNRPESENQMNLEMLFELESLFGWLTAHLEVNAVVIKGTNGQFCNGFDEKELKIMSEEKLQKYLVRFQRLISGMLALPQTIICNLGTKASGMGLEFALGADIRLAHQEAEISFNSLNKGWVPCSGGVGLLGLLVGHSMARQWTLRSKKISFSEALDKGLITDQEDHLDQILEDIGKQSPVARIQTKRSLLEAIMPELTRIFEFESIFSFASLKTNDWKKDPHNNPEEFFMSARELAEQLQDH
jgi:enoyl-CoA hydratase